MRLYLDTSIFVPLLIAERKSEAVQAWFSERDPLEVVISDWVTVEFQSAISLKLRTGQIEATIRSGGERLFSRYVADHFATVEVPHADFMRASTLIGREALTLRAGDALHLAIVERLGLEICTLDRQLFAAASAIGVPALTL